MSKTTMKAIVQKVVLKKAKSPYAVAQSRGVRGSVTFSLHASVWREKSMPTYGTSVFLDDIREGERGWRAHVARFWRPGDEQQTETAKTESKRK